MNGMNFIVIPLIGDRHLDSEAQACVVDTMNLRWGGHTVLAGHGGWFDSNGSYIADKVLRFESYGPRDTKLLSRIAEEVKAELGEESVMIGFIPCEAEFV